MTETVTKEAMPMEGLADYLRAEASRIATGFFSQEAASCLRRWAAEVEASRSLPVDGGVDERAAFEHAMHEQGWPIRRDADGEYAATYVRGAWRGWQLYAAPPSPQPSGATAEVPMPLSDERIDEIAKAQDDDEPWFTRQLTKLEWRYFARDIERAHGIAAAPALAGAPAVQEREVQAAMDAAIRYERRAYFGHNPPNTWLAQTFNNLLMANGTFESNMEANRRREEAALAALKGGQE